MHRLRPAEPDATFGVRDGRAWPVRPALVLIGLTIALGVAVRPCALDIGPLADDFAQLGMLEGRYPVARSPLDLFNFADGSREEIAALRASGFFPWWSHPELRLSMLRPLSSALMWLDLQLLGDRFRLYHLHTLAWWAGCAAALALVWRRLVPLSVGALALALFALDEAHGVLLGWIANRNALASSLFALLALAAYLARRERGLRWGGPAAAGCFALALGFGEYALTFVGYFVAYELLARDDGKRARALALWPVALPALAFLLTRALLGYGPRHSGIYVDPLIEPAAFAAAALVRVPVFLADLVLALRADYWTLGLPWTFQLYERGIVDESWLTSLQPWRTTQQLLGVVAIVAVAAIAANVLRTRGRRDPLAWLALGALLALLPSAAPFPSSRLLLAALVGFCPLAAAFIVDALAQPRRRWRVTSAIALLVPLVGVSTWHTHSEARDGHAAVRTIPRAIHAMQVDDAALPRQRLIIMNAVEGHLGFYVPLIRGQQRLSVPERCWVLSGSPMPMHLLRIAGHAFELEMALGQSATASSYEQMFRSSREPLRVGDRFDLDGMRVTVLAVRGGGFTRARFELDRPLDDPSLVFLHAGVSGLKRFDLPPVGERVYVPPPVPPAFMRL